MIIVIFRLLCSPVPIYFFSLRNHFFISYWKINFEKMLDFIIIKQLQYTKPVGFENTWLSVSLKLIFAKTQKLIWLFVKKGPVDEHDAKTTLWRSYQYVKKNGVMWQTRMIYHYSYFKTNKINFVSEIHDNLYYKKGKSNKYKAVHRFSIWLNLFNEFFTRWKHYFWYWITWWRWCWRGAHWRLVSIIWMLRHVFLSFVLIF